MTDLQRGIRKLKSKYIVIVMRSGEAHQETDQHKYSRLRDARQAALRLARRERPSWCTARPVWCGASAWHESAWGDQPVGGYDCGDEGSAAVVYRA